MRIVCGPEGFDFNAVGERELDVFLYSATDSPERGSAGKTLPTDIRRERFVPDPLAWDVLSVALGVHSADLASHRCESSDGWTREYSLFVAATAPARWAGTSTLWNELLNYLTTDRWTVSFLSGAVTPRAHREQTYATEDAVVLLSGGLDSLIGAIDLNRQGHRLLAVSQNVRGDGVKQGEFAAAIGTGLRHLQLSHTIYVPDAESPASQRSRSILFLAYGILAATCTELYRDGGTVPLYICENGFIALNPPLTENRIGSLSTRTTHPVVLSLLQEILDRMSIRVSIQNPYSTKTKGEMLVECLDQSFLKQRASQSTSCGRFKQFGYTHCGRCVPCLVRRASFRRWGVADTTVYVFDDLSTDDPDYAGFDDVRSVLIACVMFEDLGISRWLGATLSSARIADKPLLREVAQRGLTELRELLLGMGVE
jgi:hypothetical protein